MIITSCKYHLRFGRIASGSPTTSLQPHSETYEDGVFACDSKVRLQAGLGRLYGSRLVRQGNDLSLVHNTGLPANTVLECPLGQALFHQPKASKNDLLIDFSVVVSQRNHEETTTIRIRIGLGQRRRAMTKSTGTVILLRELLDLPTDHGWDCNPYCCHLS